MLPEIKQTKSSKNVKSVMSEYQDSVQESIMKEFQGKAHSKSSYGLYSQNAKNFSRIPLSKINGYVPKQYQGEDHSAVDNIGEASID